MTQNIFYKSCNELAGGVLCRAVGIAEPAPPQHWENREEAEARTQTGDRRERAAPGALGKSSRHLGVAPGPGQENREKDWGGLGVAVAGGQACSVGTETTSTMAPALGRPDPPEGGLWHFVVL